MLLDRFRKRGRIVSRPTVLVARPTLTLPTDDEVADLIRSVPPHFATRNLAYGSATTSTGGINSLATSSTWVAGYEWFVIDNTSALALDYEVQGVVRVGTTPTANTEIRLYAVASYDGTTWPDVFDGTPSAETVTSVGVRDSFARLAAVLRVDATTSDRDYPFYFHLLDIFPNVPAKTAIFVTHNTGVNLNATAGNQTYAYRPITETVA